MVQAKGAPSSQNWNQNTELSAKRSQIILLLPLWSSEDEVGGTVGTLEQ